MERRRALVVAGTMTATLAMAGTAMAVNMGLLGSDTDPVGDLTATEIQPASQSEATPAAQREPRVRVVVQDIPIASSGGSGGGGSTGTVESSDDSVAGPAPTAPYVDDDDSYDDHDDDSYDDDGGDDSDDHDDEDSDDSIDEPDDDD